MVKVLTASILKIVIIAEPDDLALHDSMEQVSEWQCDQATILVTVA